MSTNVYDLEETIHFNPDEPSKYYGWFVSTSSEDMKVAHFKYPGQRDDIINRMKAVHGLPEDAHPEVLAPLALIEALEPAGNADRIIAIELGLDEDDYRSNPVFKAVLAVGEEYSVKVR